MKEQLGVQIMLSEGDKNNLEHQLTKNDKLRELELELEELHATVDLIETCMHESRNLDALDQLQIILDHVNAEIYGQATRINDLQGL